MPLDDLDLERIASTIDRQMQPIVDLVKQHDLTLFGPKGADGMYKDIKDLKKWKDGLNKRISFLAGGIAVTVSLGKDLLKGLFK